ncbi:unnamed protein product, partial [Mesorhabditis belari]|uniref:Calcineurin-like phosphoesterase domain-containing protein n=1 Tax=Mesorhabditis belari TaxID=2138241 RepID=A0AAF3F5V6_9BILA
MRRIINAFTNISLFGREETKSGDVLLENAVNSPDETGIWLKFVVISDTHEEMAKIMNRIPDGDVLIHCGDFTNHGDEERVREFNDQLAQLPHRRKVVIAGNHENGFDAQFYEKTKLLTACELLNDTSIEIEGIKLYGSSWHTMNYRLFSTPPFYCEPGEETREKWAKIPDNVDILITHQPPKGFLDGRYGDIELLKAVEARNPKFHCFGHVHGGYGVASNEKTTFINAAQFEGFWGISSTRPPIVFYFKVPGS